MKISLKKYAQALYEATADKSEAEAKRYIANFVKILVENKDLKRADLIAKYFSKVWNHEHSVTVIDILTVQEMDSETVELLNGYIVKLFKADKVLIRKEIDKNILGGVVFRHGDMVYDGSLRTKIHNLKEQMVA